ncbi:MAG: hypothetical protein H6825_15985 [Planctomycetes bacterium]|nr:hypothetical protein [Planctomycetota bacterium]
MTRAAVVLCALLTAAPVPAPPPGVPGVAAQDASSSDDVDPLRTLQVQKAVEAAHAYLAERQNPDGSFSVHRGREASLAPVAVTGLTALSFMAAGNMPQEGRYGRYGRRVKRAIDWLVERSVQGGSRDGYFEFGADTVSRMHGHGYALLALTQAVGMYGENDEQRARLSDAIQRGVGLIERTQGLQGGWWYEPERLPAHEGSITVCMIQALRAARDAGFAVDSGTIDRATKYMADSQEASTGRFRYALKDERTSWALTAAALATLNALGDYSSGVLQNGYDALRRDDPYLGPMSQEAFLQYGAFYAAQAYFTHSDRRLFEGWWPRFVAVELDEQQPDGSWTNGTYGQVYATAITSLTLQVPFGGLPMFQR